MTAPEIDQEIYNSKPWGDDWPLNLARAILKTLPRPAWATHGDDDYDSYDPNNRAFVRTVWRDFGKYVDIAVDETNDGRVQAFSAPRLRVDVTAEGYVDDSAAAREMAAGLLEAADVLDEIQAAQS